MDGCNHWATNAYHWTSCCQILPRPSVFIVHCGENVRNCEITSQLLVFVTKDCSQSWVAMNLSWDMMILMLPSQWHRYETSASVLWGQYERVRHRLIASYWWITRHSIDSRLEWNGSSIWFEDQGTILHQTWAGNCWYHTFGDTPKRMTVAAGLRQSLPS